MMTPQEVLEKRFKAVMMGGYETSAVDSFMETITDDYSALFKENAVLKGKLKVLADKIEEYRTVDGAMRQALFNAQKMASKMVEEAEAERDGILRKARIEEDEMKREITAKAELEALRLETARKQTVTFVNSLRELYTREMEMLAAIPSLDIPESKRVIRERREASVSEDISKSVSESMEQEKPAPAETKDANENEQTGESARQPAKIIKLPDTTIDEEPEDITQRTMSIPQIIREKYPELGDDGDDIFKSNEDEDTVVPAPRSEPPSDMDQFFGHNG